MRRFFLAASLIVVGALTAFAQTSGSAGAQTQSSTRAQAGQQGVMLESGTQLAAQLQSTLDARRLNVGDQVVLRTTEAIKVNGRTVVNRGARLIGRVTEVQQRTRENAESSITLVFDQLQSGSLTAPISATITSVTQARARARTSDDSLSADTSARTTTSGRAQTSGGGGGLLGGVGNTVGSTVGGVVGTTTRTTGDVVGGATDTVGGTVEGVGQTVGSIRVTQASETSAEGGATLSLRGDNLRLERGATFRLRLNEAVRIGGN